MSDDEVGGSMRAMREQLTKEVLRAAYNRESLV
jgi:hypothetical protein